LKPSCKLESRSESDMLYEGLKRAQRCRLEDQRGTEINFELPDFLKDKENTPQGTKKLRKIVPDGDESGSKFYDGCEDHSIEDHLVKDFSCDKSIVNCESVEHLASPSVNTSVSDPPPPLPPKPKNLAALGVSWTNSEQKPRSRTRRAVYLDQPSSSFV